MHVTSNCLFVRFPKREGRLLQRFLTMTLAKDPASTATSAGGGLSSSSECPNEGGRGSATKALGGDGPVGPQVVKAFINYFAKEVRDTTPTCRIAHDRHGVYEIVSEIVDAHDRKFCEAPSVFLS